MDISMGGMLMYIIDKDKNSIQPISRKTFHELGFKERENLQEWIVNNPACLCTDENEQLLMIQKEFDGFDDTNERLDLLAIDQDGSLVVIENKLDDSGRDTVWQALKYVSYCSTLKKQQVIAMYQQYLDKYRDNENAEDNIVEFFHGKPLDEIPLNQNQRIILVSGMFRKEVTSTALWLIDHNIDVQCFKATPYKYQNNLLLDINRIIPVKEAADYMIQMADKNREVGQQEKIVRGIESLRKQFWTELLTKYKNYDSSFNNVSPTTDHWLSCGSGTSGAPFSFVITKTYASVELGISQTEAKRNKDIFDRLKVKQAFIEEQFGAPLLWERLDAKKACRIAYRLENVDITNHDDWSKISDFFCSNMPKFIVALKDELKKAAHNK